MLHSPFIVKLLADEDNIWLATEGAGLGQFTPRRLYTTTYVHHPDVAGSLSANPVNAIYEDGDGTIWVGTVEGGLNRLDSGSNGFTHYTRDNGALTHNSVSAITTDAAGNLWIGTWGGGVNVLDRRDPRRAITRLSLSEGAAYPVDFVGSLIHDPYLSLIHI